MWSTGDAIVRNDGPGSIPGASTKFHREIIMKSGPKLLSVNSVSTELTTIGKYWAFRHGSWYKVKVNTLPLGGGTGGMQYAPIDCMIEDIHVEKVKQD